MLVRQIRLKLYMFTTSPVSILYNDVKKKSYTSNVSSFCNQLKNDSLTIATNGNFTKSLMPKIQMFNSLFAISGNYHQTQASNCFLI